MEPWTWIPMADDEECGGCGSANEPCNCEWHQSYTTPDLDLWEPEESDAARAFREYGRTF